MQIISFHAGDRLLLKKPHPCGGNSFRVVRVGSQVRVVCLTCDRDMTLDRIKLEKAIRQVLPCEEEKKGNNAP
jgi:hypothetical protein